MIRSHLPAGRMPLAQFWQQALLASARGLGPGLFPARDHARHRWTYDGRDDLGSGQFSVLRWPLAPGPGSGVTTLLLDRWSSAGLVLCSRPCALCFLSLTIAFLLSIGTIKSGAQEKCVPLPLGNVARMMR